jgi:hypothetical protein
MEDQIWFDYPQELLAEAETSRDIAETALVLTPRCDTDPYNCSLIELLQRWLKRQRELHA